MDSGWAQALVGAAAAAIALFAAAFSWWQANSAKQQASEAKRQADAAHGNVEPTFHVRYDEISASTPWTIALVVNNFARHALRMTKLEVLVPDGLISFAPAGGENATAAIVRSVSAGTGEVLLNDDAVALLAGVAPNSGHSFSREFIIRITRRPHSEMFHDITGVLLIEYTLLDGVDEPKKTSRAFSFRAPAPLAGDFE